MPDDREKNNKDDTEERDKEDSKNVEITCEGGIQLPTIVSSQ